MTRRQAATDDARPARKRMLAAGRKINGIWNVTTFLRAAAGGPHETFWEARQPPTASRRRPPKRAR